MGTRRQAGSSLHCVLQGEPDHWEFSIQRPCKCPGLHPGQGQPQPGSSLLAVISDSPNTHLYSTRGLVSLPFNQGWNPTHSSLSPGKGQLMFAFPIDWPWQPAPLISPLCPPSTPPPPPSNLLEEIHSDNVESLQQCLPWSATQTTASWSPDPDPPVDPAREHLPLFWAM